MIVDILWLMLQLLIGYNLIFPIFLYAGYLLAGRRTFVNIRADEYDYAVIVTAYEQTDLLPAVVSSLLKMEYSNYLIYLVCDNCDISNLHFTDERVVLLRPEKVLASNTRSHLYAISNFKRPHELLTIIDSDNLVDRRYLKELNVYFDNGFDAVQGQRRSKSLETSIASLDAARDLYYHFFDGKVMFALGSSATLAGSGMAFKTALYVESFINHDLQGAGFDKVLQAKIVSRNLRIAYAPAAIVYDEKTANRTQLENQRSRWINTWFKYFSLGFSIIARGITKFSWNQFLFGIVLLRPPLFLFILLSILCFIINLIFWGIGLWLWIFAFLAFGMSFFVALRHGRANRNIYLALVGIPSFIYVQVRSLMRIRHANKRSVATRHLIK
ncbi:glycosyltransferase [Pedobacter jeongneungensis]|uniref:glycosyltransferase n=1 Tax=Pedobacter jeongneungensis TaxID=947309 RepID=UPI0005637A47|nr:glycosyltransferase [Pedobacter jeongneungensis]